MTPEEYLEALLNLPGMLNPQVSPDGKWAAWTWRRTGPAADVFAAPTDGSAPPIRLTETPDDTLVVSWTPDSRAVIVEQDKDGNERVQLFRAAVTQPGVMIPLTEPDPNYFIRGGVLHPNGRWLVYGANVDAATGQEIEPTRVYRHDLQSGERRVLARTQKGCWYLPELNTQGTHVLYTRNEINPNGRQMWLVDIEGSEDREILNFGADVKVFATWMPDGRRAIVLAETKTHQRVGVWELGRESIRWLIDDPDRNIEEAYVPHGSDRAVIIEIRGARLRASLLDVESGQEIRLPEIAGNLRPLAPIAGGVWAGQYYSSRQPADIVRFSPADPNPATFTSLSRVWERTALKPGDLTPAEDFRWKSIDGLEIQGWLYRPTGQVRGTVVFIHGGPTMHSADAINNQIQLFVRQGYTVLDPNYRGSTGFSLAYRDAIKIDGWGGREQDDIRAGIEALLAAGIAEKGTVGVTGTSYGGYSSWCAITHLPPELVAASAPICGMTDLVLDYQTTRPDLRPYSEEMMGGRPDQVPERFRDRSPIHFVSNIKGRLLIVQGLQDPNVSPENVRVVTTALQQANIEYELLAFEDEGHGVSRPKNQKVLYQRLAEFFGSAFAGAK
ncbi:MAG TPA: prolyl oligopeptidase family serine peptidase [Anaerolineae bacterium]